MDRVTKKIVLNGSEREVKASPTSRLIDLFRLELGLTGTKEGCGEGECGACSIILNDDAVNSCLILFGQLEDGDRITTIEGLGGVDHLSPLQDSFISEVGVQCGMCTPGMIISAHVLLMRNKNPSREEIATALSGNICRCTGYVKIIDSVERAASILRGKSK